MPSKSDGYEPTQPMGEFTAPVVMLCRLEPQTP